MSEMAQDRPTGRPVGIVSGRTASRISLAAFGMSLGLFLVITYLLCVLYGLFVFDEPMRQMLTAVLPGFTWLTWASFFLGLIESFAYGWYAAILFVPLYNWFAARLG